MLMKKQKGNKKAKILPLPTTLTKKLILMIIYLKKMNQHIVQYVIHIVKVHVDHYGER